MFPFNIRVYGVLINEQKQVLVTDEKIREKEVTKFPGGGLEFGEGTRECLVREFYEEIKLKIEVTDHLYTTDFFQLSAFDPGHQVISIYYLVKALEPLQARISTAPFQFDDEQLKIHTETGETESFRLVSWEDLSEETMTLPIDKIVAGLLKEKF